MSKSSASVQNNDFTVKRTQDKKYVNTKILSLGFKHIQIFFLLYSYT